VICRKTGQRITRMGFVRTALHAVTAFTNAGERPATELNRTSVSRDRIPLRPQHQ